MYTFTKDFPTKPHFYETFMKVFMKQKIPPAATGGIVWEMDFCQIPICRGMGWEIIPQAASLAMYNAAKNFNFMSTPFREFSQIR